MILETKKNLTEKSVNISSSSQKIILQQNCTTMKFFLVSSIVIKLDRFTNCTRERPVAWGSGTSVFRVHAYSTHEMVTAAATYVGNEKSYKAQLLLTFPVKYTVMVILVYINGLAVHLLGDANPLLKQLPGSPFDVTVSKDNSTNQKIEKFAMISKIRLLNQSHNTEY